MGNERTTLRVIVCRPNKRAEVVEIDDSLMSEEDVAFELMGIGTGTRMMPPGIEDEVIQDILSEIVEEYTNEEEEEYTDEEESDERE